MRGRFGGAQHYGESGFHRLLTVLTPPPQEEGAELLIRTKWKSDGGFHEIKGSVHTIKHST